MPGFEGYLIAVTNFMYCHALAFITDKGGDGPGHTYPAVHIPRGTAQLTQAPTWHLIPATSMKIVGVAYQEHP